jgi:hypothetical protein
MSLRVVEASGDTKHTQNQLTPYELLKASDLWIRGSRFFWGGIFNFLQFGNLWEK